MQAQVKVLSSKVKPNPSKNIIYRARKKPKSWNILQIIKIFGPIFALKYVAIFKNFKLKLGFRMKILPGYVEIEKA